MFEKIAAGGAFLERDDTPRHAPMQDVRRHQNLVTTIAGPANDLPVERFLDATCFGGGRVEDARRRAPAGLAFLEGARRLAMPVGRECRATGPIERPAL